MEILNIVWNWIYDNPYSSLAILIGILEFGTRFTPTEKDEGFVQRLGILLKFILDTIKVPNVVKKTDTEL